jgi:predicted alpha/beta-hydrolase family hydrolase
VLHLAAGKLAIAVGSKGGEGKGMVVKDLKPPRAKCKKILYPFHVLAEPCKID